MTNLPDRRKAARLKFQRLPPARGGTAQKKILHLANWSQLIHPGPASSMTKMLQVEDHLNLLSAQYLVQCLDTDNVCHHITKMDLPPREMKETIFTRHYQTVLPLLANNRKDTVQALHTSFVNTAIGNMKDNRVLNSRPPSINDEETLLQTTKDNSITAPFWTL